MLGTSGEGVEDMQAFSELSALDALVTSVREAEPGFSAEK